MKRRQDDVTSVSCYIMKSSIETSKIARFMGPTWGPPWAGRPQVGPMLAPWALLSGIHAYWVELANGFLENV